MNRPRSTRRKAAPGLSLARRALDATIAHAILHLSSAHSLATVVLAALAAIPSSTLDAHPACRALAPVIAAAVLAAKSIQVNRSIQANRKTDHETAV